MYEHVLVGTDGSPTAMRAVEAAARLARAHDARLTIVHAFKPRPPSPRDERFRELWPRMTSGVIADEIVKRAEHHARAAVGGALDVETLHGPGKPVAVLRRAVTSLSPDVVVVGNADLRRPRAHRSIGHALSRKVHSDVVVVDTSNAASPRAAR